MFCFSSSRSKKKQRYRKVPCLLDVSIEFPIISRESLPTLAEHKIQDPNEEIIDDPSTIFYDPNEKSDFTYSAVPLITQGVDYSYEQPSFEDQESTFYLNPPNVIDDIRDERLLSPEYDDSLDGNSRPVTPQAIRKGNSSFEGEFDMSSRRDSLEFENIDERLDYPLHNIDNFLPGRESTRNATELHQNSFQENSFIDDYGGLNLYEDNILSDVRALNFNNKGYMSDAESVKTYQDSGIYDDDLDDSPKSLTSVARQLVFGTDAQDFMAGEKYTAFKTPMSSRQSSVESLTSELIDYTQRNLEDTRGRSEDQSKENFSPPKTTTKSSNKYSYVQAKVQCYRTKGDRSPSPGTSIRNKSPGTGRPRSSSPGNTSKINKRQKSPGGTYTNNTISSNNKTKVKTKSSDQMLNERNKIFNEKLTFREKAKPRTDSHGVEMYSNLPKEFQEIARRLARQDRDLKKSESDMRGRSSSRRSSRMTSRASSVSPTRKARSKSESRDLDNMEIFSAEKGSETPSKQLSRSSSIRSIPSTPAIGRQHPLPELQARAKSPSASPGRSPAHRASHEKKDKNKQKKKRNSGSGGKKLSTPSPVSKLYTFTTVNDSFGTSPIGSNSMFPIEAVH